MSTPQAPPPGGPGYPPQGAPAGSPAGYPTQPDTQQPTHPVSHPGYPPPGAQQYQQGGPGLQERAGQMADRVGRHVKTPETKEFFKTSEFAVWLLTVLALLIAGATIGDNGGGDDNLRAGMVWTLVTATSFAYIISRGISKAGTRRGKGDAPMD